jgi:hypothetical protein
MCLLLVRNRNPLLVGIERITPRPSGIACPNSAGKLLLIELPGSLTRSFIPQGTFMILFILLGG